MGFEKEEGSSHHSLTCPREDTPLLLKPPKLSSQSKTFANVFIAIVGAGVLGLPYAFKKTGWIMGVSMIFIVSYISYYCMMLLVYTRRKLEKEGFKRISSFGDLGFTVCGSIGRFAVDIMIVLSQAGFCVSYFIFIANTLVNVFDSPGLSQIWGFKLKSLFIWGLFPFQLGLNSIPTLTHLAPLSIFADVVDIGAMGIVMIEDAMIFLKQRPVLETFGGFSVVFYGIGVAVYAFEGVGMVLPLESETANKEKFGRTLGWSMGTISLMYGLFGALGYFAFGEETNDIITTNLGKGFLTSLVQLGLCINLFFTFPIMMNPVHEVAERRLNHGQFSLFFRWIMVLTVVIVALSVPNFADFLSLVGSSVCCFLGFVFPSLFHLIVFKEESSMKVKIIDIGIMVLGTIVAISGTYTSLMEIMAVNKV